MSGEGEDRSDDIGELCRGLLLLLSMILVMVLLC